MKDKKVYKTDKKGIIISLLIFSFVLMLSVGYAALNEELTISGEAHFRVESDIRITDVRLSNTINSASEDYASLYGKESMKVGATLPNNNSSATYKVKITNYSNVAMQLKSITKEIENNNYTITFNKTLPLTVGKQSSEEIEITFKNSTNESQTINANLLFTFAKEEAVMASGNDGAATSTFYNGPLTKNSIESITFMPTKEIPEDAIGYWDASAVQGTNKVMAYYLNSETEGMYDLYIAADGEVYAPYNSRYLFYKFTNVTSIDFNNSFNTEKATNMRGMFTGDTKLSVLDVNCFNTSKVTEMNYSNTVGMFQNCSSLTSLNLSNWDTKNVTYMGYMFAECSKLTTITLGSDFNTEKVTNFGGMFYNCSKLTSIDTLKFNTANVEKFNDAGRGMFQNCSSLTSLNLVSWDTKKAYNMNSMFSGCSGLTSITFGEDFDTSNASSLQSMFYGCSGLTSLDLNTFNTEKVTSMESMFKNCSKLTNLDLSNFRTPKLTSMYQMFQNCTRLQNVDISNFTTESLTTMFATFTDCSSLKEVDMRNMDFEGKTVATQNVFLRIKSGVNIYVLNAYNQTYIQGLRSDANVIIYVPPEPEV